jgi:hypothetical protein
MPPYDDWNKFDEDEDEELQDTSVRVLAIGLMMTSQTHDRSSAVP